MQLTESKMSPKPSFGTSLQVRTDAPSEATETSLFSNIKLDAVIPEMPDDLVPFDKEITNAEAKNDAMMAFLVHLGSKLTGRPLMPEEFTSACLSAEAISIFFPEWPMPDEYAQYDENGKYISGSEAQSPEYNRLFAEANIATAAARRDCVACPLRAQCLTKSMSYDEVQEGMWGGWGKYPRIKIQNQFDILRRAYNAGKRSIEEGLGKKKYKGMSPDDIARYEARALALISVAV